MSDMLNSISRFVQENPEWYAENGTRGRMSLALAMFATICESEYETTHDEDAFLNSIFHTMKETA